MAVKTTRIPTGPLDYILDFERAGDVFGEHTHDVASNHMSIVARGRMRETVEGREYGAPDVIDWPAGVPHGFLALTDGLRVVNIQKRG